MTCYAAFLRAVNVGGTGRLTMADLRAICVGSGFTGVETILASGNVVFRSDRSEDDVKAALRPRLHAHAGAPVGVIVCTSDELAGILALASPWVRADRMIAILLDAPPSATALDGITGRAREDIRLGTREILVHYPNGIGRSRLTIPAARHGTARNMNTLAKVAAMMSRHRVT